MSNVLAFLRVFALGTWVGSIVYFVAVVTRGAFAVLTRDQAGLLVGFTLCGLHQLGIIAAVVYLVATLALGRSLQALVQPAALGVILMLLLTLYSQRIVIPRMAVLRTDMGSVDTTPGTDPRRAEFDELHCDLRAGRGCRAADRACGAVPDRERRSRDARFVRESNVEGARLKAAATKATAGPRYASRSLRKARGKDSKRGTSLPSYVRAGGMTALVDSAAEARMFAGHSMPR